MAKIYIIEGTEEVLKKNREPISLIIRGWKKLLKFLNNFFNMNYFLNTHHFSPIYHAHIQSYNIYFFENYRRYQGTRFDPPTRFYPTLPYVTAKTRE